MVKMTSGNKKLGKKVLNISRTPCATCPSDAPCRAKCYAMKAYRQYPNVRQAWNGNTEAAKNLPEYFKDINTIVSKKKPVHFRWHVAGDIDSQEYLNGMKLVARANPDTKFLAFTKNHNLDFVGLPKNLEVVASLWPNWGKDTVGLRKAWMQDGTENRIPATALVCPGSCETCKACWSLTADNRDVVFNVH